MKSYPKFAVLALGLLLSPFSHAALIGEDVEGVFFGGSQGTQTVVDPGLEFSVTGNAGATLQADLFDTSLDLIFNSAGIGGLGANFTWAFTLTNPDLTFSSVTETFDDFVNGVNFDSISNAGKTINFTILDQANPLNTTFIASYALGIADASASSVPVPAPLALMLAGFVGIGALRRGRTDA